MPETTPQFFRRLNRERRIRTTLAAQEQAQKEQGYHWRRYAGTDRGGSFNGMVPCFCDIGKDHDDR